MKKIFVALAIVLALSIGVFLVVNTVRAEKIGVAEITLSQGASVSKDDIEKSLLPNGCCADFAVKSMKTTADGKVLCEIGGMRGGCCLKQAETVLKKVEGVEAVALTLQSGKTDQEKRNRLGL